MGGVLGAERPLVAEHVVKDEKKCVALVLRNCRLLVHERLEVLGAELPHERVGQEAVVSVQVRGVGVDDGREDFLLPQEFLDELRYKEGFPAVAL